MAPLTLHGFGIFLHKYPDKVPISTQYKLISSHQPKTSHYSGYNFAVVVEVAACHITQLSAAKATLVWSRRTS